MNSIFRVFVGSLSLLLVTIVHAAPINPLVNIETSNGTVVLELDVVKAPLTVQNFIDYVESGYYDGLIFHRVIDGFMIQGGGFDQKMVQANTGTPIKNEANNGLMNQRGSIAMARTNNPDSATSQFFINLKDNAFLNRSSGNPGYAVFGRVLKGMDVIDDIAKVKTSRMGPHNDVPVEPVVIKKASIRKADNKVMPDKKAEPIKSVK